MNFNAPGAVDHGAPHTLDSREAVTAARWIDAELRIAGSLAGVARMLPGAAGRARG